MSTTMLHIRIEDGLKAEASETLKAMGFTLSDAVRIFLTRVVAEQAIPFQVKVPNAGTRAAMDEARRMADGRFRSAEELLESLGETSDR